ncbi:MAG: hypothetical protein V1742_11245 [Pseudomonadota bacterium]
MDTEKCIGTGEIKNGVYRTIMDWTMVLGARVSEERIKQLMEFDFEGFHDLSLDDMIACNNRKAQVILWAPGVVLEKLIGEEKTREYYYELGRMIGHKGWSAVLKHFKTDKLTPAQVAWYQDMAHFFYGPHTQAYTEYTEDTVVVTRSDCMVSYPPPGMEAMNKYVVPFADGYLQAYKDLSPYLEITHQPFIREEEMAYPVDLTKYPSFCKSKRAGQPFNHLVFKWIK